MKLKISVHKGCKNKTQKPATDWQRVKEDIEWLLGFVSKGYGWCATHFQDRHRKADNARGSNLVVVDLDGDTTLEDFWETETAQQWCAATYTTASHSASEHRFRALFPLELELGTTGQHQGAYWLIANRLCAELDLDKLKDNCGEKPERLWYGNSEAQVKRNDGAVVPAFLLEDIDYAGGDIDFNSGNASPLDIARCKWILEHFLRPTDDGEYETHYQPVLAACASIGEEMFEVWQSWVLSGHHGSKPENSKKFKWKGMGGKSSYKSLYAQARKQDSGWTKKLPASLRFKASGNAAGYAGDPDPSIDYNALENTAPQLKPAPAEELPDPLPEIKFEARRGRPKKSASDQAKERQQDIEEVKRYLPGLGLNLLNNTIEYFDDNGNKQQIQGNDLNLMTTKFAIEYNTFIPENRMQVAVKYVASQNEYCPIRKYLDCCERTAQPHKDWDRLGEVFLGNAAPLANLTLQRFLIGAVARCYEPGCEMSWLPILVGAQGVGKSMFSRSLVPTDLFSEVTTNVEVIAREQYRLHMSWLLELPEIDQHFQHRNIENFKNMVTTRIDEVRFPYEPHPKKLKRRFVMIGSTNKNQFLIDPTGNRRFIPLEIGNGFLVPWQRLIQERDSIWAAAVAAYKRNESYIFTSGEIAERSDYIQQFNEQDAWHDLISDLVKDREQITIAELLKGIGIEVKNQDKMNTRRVSDCLQQMGWRRHQTTQTNKITGKRKTVRLWMRPLDDPIDEPVHEHDF